MLGPRERVRDLHARRIDVRHRVVAVLDDEANELRAVGPDVHREVRIDDAPQKPPGAWSDSCWAKCVAANSVSKSRPAGWSSSALTRRRATKVLAALSSRHSSRASNARARTWLARWSAAKIATSTRSSGAWASRRRR